MLNLTLTKTQHNICSFYSSNLFERLVVYLLFSKLIASFYAEILLGQSLYSYPRASQWIFFFLLATDYIVTYKKVLLLNFSINLQSLFSLLLLVMIAHGIFVGFVNKNHIFEIFNDTVPLLMIAINILRMQSFGEPNNINLKRLLTISSWISLLQILTSVGSGWPLPFSFIYFSIFITAILTSERVSKYQVLIFLVYCVLALPDWNRTTLISVLIIIFSILIKSILSKPLKALFIAGVTIIVIGLLQTTIPDDSRLRARLNSNIDFSSRTGSVGERQAEWEAIKTTLKQKGIFYEWCGLGMGGTYTVKFTHKYNEDYGHAHYSWAWFTLRFGNLGLIYMTFLFYLLIYIAKDIMMADGLKILMALLAIFSIFYMFTYVNGVWLTSGLIFYFKRSEQH